MQTRTMSFPKGVVTVPIGKVVRISGAANGIGVPPAW
jgi:hypothetical protein